MTDPFGRVKVQTHRTLPVFLLTLLHLSFVWKLFGLAKFDVLPGVVSVALEILAGNN